MMTLSIDPVDGETRVAVTGDVTDDADFEPLEHLCGKVAFELGGLRRFNSGGVSRWMAMVRSLTERKVSLRFEHASDAFLFQWAMMPGLTGGGRIDSMVLTYACERCELCESVEARRAEHFADGKLAPPAAPACPRCTQPMELDTVLGELPL